MGSKEVVFASLLTASVGVVSGQEIVTDRATTDIQEVIGKDTIPQSILRTQYYGDLYQLDLGENIDIAMDYGVDSIAYSNRFLMINDEFFEIEGCKLVFFCKYLNIDTIQQRTDTLYLTLHRADNGDIIQEDVGFDDFFSMLSEVYYSDNHEKKVKFDGGKLVFHRVSPKRKKLRPLKG